MDLGPEKSTDLTNFVTSACVAVNQIAHIQARTLAANAKVCREAFLEGDWIEICAQTTKSCGYKK